MGSSAVVALAYWLGAGWLAQGAMGLPAGVWVVVLLTAWSARLQRGAGGVAAAKAPAAGATGHSLNSGSAWTTRGRIRLAFAAARVMDLIDVLDDLLARTPLGGIGLGDDWRQRLSRRLMGIRLPAGALRLGFGTSRRRAQQVIDQDPAGAEWFLVSRGVEPEAAATEHALDAVLTEPAPGVIRIQTLERPGADASWFDWGVRRPLSYEAVFPLRLDPAQVHLDLSAEGELAGSAEIVAELLRTAAILSRHPERLDVQDHILGRRPSSRWPGVSSELESLGGAEDESVQAMTRLAMLMEQRSRGGRSTAADRAAARAVSSWLASWDEAVQDDQRRSWIEACSRVLPDEPEVMLRLAAVRLAAMDDEMGIAALRDADAMLQREEGLCVGDPVAFLQAELEHGPENPMTVARVAAGLCLALAGVPTSQIAFLQEDLLDDMRFASWLVGRDQDRAILMRVLRELREARERREALARDESEGSAAQAA